MTGQPRLLSSRTKVLTIPTPLAGDSLKDLSAPEITSDETIVTVGASLA